MLLWFRKLLKYFKQLNSFIFHIRVKYKCQKHLDTKTNLL